MHVEAAHVWSHDRQIFLNLDRHARFGDVTAAMRTAARKRHVNALIDCGRRLTMAMTTVAPTGTPTRWARTRRRGTLRERRRLPLTCASRSLKRLRQSLDLVAQAIALTLKLRVFLAQLVVFVLDTLVLWRSRSRSCCPSSIDVGRVRFGTRLLCQNLPTSTRATR
jgi:hypothetical protein